jgi:phosphopantothenoylcysteine decarboxylase/phosphopantothenate--cysteine ligase
LGVMGGDRNTVHLLTQDANGVRDANGVGDANSIRDGNGVGVDIKIESWPVMTKEEVASTLVARIASQVEKKL